MCDIDRSSADMEGIRQRLQCKKVCVTTDDGTVSQGHAILNIGIGTAHGAFACATKALECSGPNDGVEHSEVGGARPAQGPV